MSPPFDNIHRRKFPGISPEVVFLPIVVRELRVTARRPRTYYGRMMAAAAAYVLIGTSAVGIGKADEQDLFRAVSGGLFVWSLVCACVEADSISREKREVTIGFLFLTEP